MSKISYLQSGVRFFFGQPFIVKYVWPMQHLPDAEMQWIAINFELELTHFSKLVGILTITQCVHCLQRDELVSMMENRNEGWSGIFHKLKKRVAVLSCSEDSDATTSTEDEEQEVTPGSTDRPSNHVRRAVDHVRRAVAVRPATNRVRRAVANPSAPIASSPATLTAAVKGRSRVSKTIVSGNYFQYFL